VGALQRFEKRLEGMVEGAFARMFKGVVHPVEILNALQREAEAQKSPLPGGRFLVPNRYLVLLSAGDQARLASYTAALGRELAQAHTEYLGEQGWTVYGDVVVEIVRGDDALDTGSFRVVAQVHTGDTASYGAGAGVRLVTEDGRNYPLGIGPTVVGRGDGASVRLADVGASREHARVDYDGQQVALTDLGSANGTFVNGRRVETVTLNPGDAIQIGGTRLTLRTDGAPEATRVQRPVG
jgi:hypothetical protein